MTEKKLCEQEGVEAEKFFSSFLPEGEMEEGHRHLFELAARYPRFFALESLRQGVEAQALDSRQKYQVVLNWLQGTIPILETSLENQRNYHLVNKCWNRGVNRGALVVELDVRLDAEGEFWISHGINVGKPLISPAIHTLKTEQMKEKGKKMSLSDALVVLRDFKGFGHRLIIELKTLGKDSDKFPEVAQRLIDQIKAGGVQEAVAIASLSPGILETVNAVMPELPLISLGGMMPIFSYFRDKDRKSIFQESDMAFEEGKVMVIGGGPMEMVFTSGDTSPKRPDGHGKQMGYAYRRIPRQLRTALQAQHRHSSKLGGRATLSVVSMMANVLQMMGGIEVANLLRQYYSEVLNELNVGKMSITWGQNWSHLPFLSHLSAPAQVQSFRDFYGEDTLIYTDSPEKWAHLLAKRNG